MSNVHNLEYKNLPCEGRLPNEQRRNYTWDSGGNIVFSVSTRRRTCQSLEEKHRSASTSGLDSLQNSPRLCEPPSNAKTKPSALLLENQPRTRRSLLPSKHLRVRSSCTHATKDGKEHEPRTVRKPRRNRQAGYLEDSFDCDSSIARRFSSGCFSLCAYTVEAAEQLFLPKSPIDNRYWDARDELVYSCRSINTLLHPRSCLDGLSGEVNSALPTGDHATKRPHHSLAYPVVLLRRQVQHELQRTQSNIKQYCFLIDRFYKRRRLDSRMDGIIEQVRYLYPSPDFLAHDEPLRDLKLDYVLDTCLQTRNSLRSLRTLIPHSVRRSIVWAVYPQMFSEEKTRLSQSLIDFHIIIRRRARKSQKQGYKASSGASNLKEPTQVPLPNFQDLISDFQTSNVIKSISVGRNDSSATATRQALKSASAANRMLPSAEVRKLVSTQEANDGQAIRNHSEFPEYEKSSNLAFAVQTSLYRPTKELNYFIMEHPKSNKKELILSKIELEYGGDEMSRFAHNARWWCRFREQWHALPKNQQASKSSYMVATLRQRIDSELGTAFLYSWNRIYNRFSTVEKLRKTYYLSSPEKSKRLFVRLMGPLIKTFKDVNSLLHLGYDQMTTENLYPLIQFTRSWRILVRSLRKNNRYPVTPLFLYHCAKCSRSYRALKPFLNWLHESMSVGSSPAEKSLFAASLDEVDDKHGLPVSIKSSNSVSQYQTSKHLKGEEKDRVFKRTVAGSLLGPHERPEPQIQHDKPLIYLNSEIREMDSRSQNSDPHEPPRPQSSSLISQPHQHSGSFSKDTVVRRSNFAAFHTATQASEPSFSQSDTFVLADRFQEQDYLTSNNSDMARQPLSGPLGYHIPSCKMRESMLASKNSRSAYWQYTLYEGLGGQKVKVHYCKSLETTERIARLFSTEKVIGFDIEWKPSATFKDGIRKNVALIQMASEERIALFHIARFSKDDNIKSLVAPTVKAIMESSSITKVGVAIKGDCTRLKKYMNIDSHGLFELSHLYKLVKFSLNDVKQINRRLVNLAQQVEEHLMLPMYKDESVRGSDWSEDLNHEQIYYAASDSYAGFQLYHTLNNKRLSLSPCPPLPANAELDLPIRLANGQTVKEYEQSALEESPPDESTESTPLASTERLAKDVMNLEIEDNGPPPVIQQTEPPKPKPRSSPSLSSHPSIIAANDWIAKY
ncbi:MAG: hypothetical protein Q9213_006978, partial [Squamulea squamosa]